MQSDITVEIPALLLPGEQRRLQTFFLASAARYPEAYALSLGERKFTYASLEDEARRWAGALLEGCRGQVQRVGIFAYRSRVAYVGVLASLFAGATYVPLNQTFPLQRTRSMIECADLDAIIVDERSFSQFQALAANLEKPLLVLCPEAHTVPSWPSHLRVLNSLALQKMPSLRELPIQDGEAIAYLLFTSGSTGQPKGVPVTHNNVVSFLAWNLRKYQLTPEDRLTQSFDLTFDLAVFDLFMAWGSGACLCVLQPIQLLAPFQFLREQDVTVWFSVPSVLSLYRKKQMLKANSLPTLRWSLFCGEALPQAGVAAWQEAAPQSIIENLYGPTELTIACAAYRWNPASSPEQCVNGIVPIGQVYAHLDHLVVDEALQPVAPGQAGELCVSGSQMFPGYWRDPIKTASRVFQFQQRDYYRTGDLVRWQQEHYIYLGRTDQQVKIQGYRIELGEIESVLRRAEHVVEAAAVAWPLENGKAQGIVAFVSGNYIELSRVQRMLKEAVPSYMLPQQIHILESMPHNVNGKIDYNALRRSLAAQ